MIQLLGRLRFRTALRRTNCRRLRFPITGRIPRHIANEVVTAAIMLHDKVRLEASGFFGTEPDENRWNIDYGPINSWGARFSVFPTQELDGAGFCGEDNQAGTARTWRCGARHCVRPLHAAYAGIELVHQFDLGTQP